jgi:hypothetical protein
MLPPTPAAVAEYFRRRLSTISEFSPNEIRYNEGLWVVDFCGLPESALDPAPIITREGKFGHQGQYDGTTDKDLSTPLKQDAEPDFPREKAA